MNTRNVCLLSSFVATLILSTATATWADFIAISQPSSAAATQTGGPYNVANSFTVNSAGIYIQDIGIFASLGNGTNPGTPKITATNPVSVGIYHADGSSAGIDFTTLTTSNTKPYGSTGMVVLDSFTPVHLAPGNYLVVASDIGSLPAQPTANSVSGPGPNYDNGGGLITIPPSSGTTSFFSSYTGTPAVPTGADTHLYTAGTFIFSATPEPSSFVLGGLGVAGLALAARRRRRA